MKHTIIPAVHLLLVRDGKIHLARRYNTGWQDGNWSVIAGHVENHETPLEAILREGKEEAGIELQGIQCIHSMHRIIDVGDRIDFFCVADSWIGEIQICEPEKCDAMEWFDINSLPENTIPYIRQAIEHMLQGSAYSQRDERETLK